MIALQTLRTLAAQNPDAVATALTQIIDGTGRWAGAWSHTGPGALDVACAILACIDGDAAVEVLVCVPHETFEQVRAHQQKGPWLLTPGQLQQAVFALVANLPGGHGVLGDAYRASEFSD